jgi:hydrogenase maturation protein HypF
MPPLSRLRLTLSGSVQGVGFRPFVYRLAMDLQLVGWVKNSASGVTIEVEGDRPMLELFRQRVQVDKPSLSSIQNLESMWLEPVGDQQFEIHTSATSDRAQSAIMLPDLATCADCLREIFDPQNRRYRYPFTNCTHCGPRYSILEGLPYDRDRTTLRGFQMCPACRLEYDHPRDRRFHAQPNACPVCGPHLELWDQMGQVLATNDRALLDAAHGIRSGKIVAVKGLGGFHLIVDARNESAVRRLRQRKRRPDKPFAVMYPSIERVRGDCRVSELEERWLRSPQAPIVLLRRSRDSQKDKALEATILGECDRLSSPDYAPTIAPAVAPGNPYLGVMLPYTPLHHLLLAELGFPVVATSGNLSDEPICIDEGEAIQRLGRIADSFLVHNRPIARSVDDSVVRAIVNGLADTRREREMVLRRSRGYAPLPIPIHTLGDRDAPSKILAVGGHLKNTIAIALEGQAFLSQHKADIAFQTTINHLSRIYNFQPEAIACDAHPDYRSTQFAQQQPFPIIPVQHHCAHVLACLAEHHLTPPVLGVAGDGTGYGLDGTIWGGEFLYVTEAGFDRVAHWRSFPLPGGDRAVKEPRRAALGLLYELLGDAAFFQTHLFPLQAFSQPELSLLQTALQKGLNAPKTSSIGRFFDAIASLLGLYQTTTFEGQAAMALEFSMEAIASSYSLEMRTDSPIQINWEPLIRELLVDLEQGRSIGFISAKFHHTLVEAIVTLARKFPDIPIILTGGCFQNKFLLERSILRLHQAGLSPYWHRQIPPNDGGIALGQIVAAKLSPLIQ